MWSAAVTSVVGASYTSVSFLRTLSAGIERRQRATIITMIVMSTAIFLLVGRPVTVLVLVGALNGLLLPVGLGVMLVAAYRRRVVGAYRHPLWLTVVGSLVVAAMTVMAVVTAVTELGR